MNLNEKYKQELLNSIPVVTGMEIDIKNIDKFEISLTAPLSTNINYEGTAFGGSLNTLCILASYLMTHHSVKSEKLELSSLVIQDSSIQYLKPVQDDFIATARIDEKELNRFLGLISVKGKSRLNVEATISTLNDTELVKFKGRFVAKIDLANS